MEKILATVYLFFLFFLALAYLFYQISALINRMKARKQMKMAREQSKPYEPEPVIDVVGKSTTAFLAPLSSASNEPFMNDNLEKESASETEPDILPDDVDVKMSNPYVPDDDELEQYAGDGVDASGDFSQGLTCQQISDAIDVVEGRKSGETEEYLAGETFCIMPDDFLNVICMQTEHEIIVKKLIEGYVDSVGKVKPATSLVENFDINKYV